MSCGLWNPDIPGAIDGGRIRGGRRRGNNRGCRGGWPRVAPRRPELALRDKLGANHRDVARGFNSKPDLSPLDPYDGHADVVADKKLFHQLPGQHQHSALSSHWARAAPRALPHRDSHPGPGCGLVKGNVGYDFARGPPPRKIAANGFIAVSSHPSRNPSAETTSRRSFRDRAARNPQIPGSRCLDAAWIFGSMMRSRMANRPGPARTRPALSRL